MLRWAAAQARKSEVRFRVGAVDDYGGYAHNERHPRPILTRWGYPPWANLHAEASLCLKKEKAWGAQITTVWVCRLTRDGLWAMARPCPCCVGMLDYCGVKRVVWTTGPGTWAEGRL